MYRVFLILTFLLNSIGTDAQYFEIDSIVGMDVFDQESKFILVKSKKNKKAAETINTFLQKKVLYVTYEKGNEDIFNETFPTEESMGGMSFFDFNVILNNSSLFSITISYESTGAYTEYYEEHFNFNSQTGEYLQLDSFFPSGSLIELGELVNGRCINEIDEFLKEIENGSMESMYDDRELYLEYTGYQKEMYGNCKSSFEEWDGPPNNNFWITDSTFVFTNERCSNHAMAAVDELWTFEIDITISALHFYMSEEGKTFFKKPE